MDSFTIAGICVVVISNLATIPAIIWSLKFHQYLAATNLIAVTCFSIAYHIVFGVGYQTDYNDVLQYMDFFLSINMVCLFSTYLLGWEKLLKKYNDIQMLPFWLMTCITAFLVYQFRFEWWVIVAVVGMGVLFNVISWIFIVRGIPKFDWIDASIGLFLITVGIISQYVIAPRFIIYYNWIHGLLWHVPIFTAPYFVLEIRRKSKVLFCIPTTSCYGEITDLIDIETKDN